MHFLSLKLNFNFCYIHAQCDDIPDALQKYDSLESISHFLDADHHFVTRVIFSTLIPRGLQKKNPVGSMQEAHRAPWKTDHDSLGSHNVAFVKH